MFVSAWKVPLRNSPKLCVWRRNTKRTCTWTRPTASGPWVPTARASSTISTSTSRTSTSWWERSPKVLAPVEDILQDQRYLIPVLSLSAFFKNVLAPVEDTLLDQRYLIRVLLLSEYFFFFYYFSFSQSLLIASQFCKTSVLLNFSYIDIGSTLVVLFYLTWHWILVKEFDSMLVKLF